MSALPLFPDSAAVEGGELRLGGVAAVDTRGGARHAARRATAKRPCGRGRARTGRRRRRAAVLYSVKAFPNVAVLRVFAEEGLGAEASTLGELAFAQRAGDRRRRRSCWTETTRRTRSCAAAAEAGCLVVLDAPDDVERAAAARRAARARARDAGHRRRHALGDRDRPPRLEVRADAGAGVRDDRALRRARAGRRQGLHVHIGSQLLGRRRGADGHRLARRVRRRLPHGARLDAGRRRPRRRARHPLHGGGPAAAVETFVRALLERARARVVAPRPAAAARHPRARPLARRAGGRDALPRRLR